MSIRFGLVLSVLWWVMGPLSAGAVEVALGGGEVRSSPAVVGASFSVEGGACQVEGEGAAVVDRRVELSPGGARRLRVLGGAGCDRVFVVEVLPSLVLPEATAVVWVDAGLVEVEGVDLRGMRLGVVQGGALVAEAGCSGASSCTLSIEPGARAALARGEAQLVRWPGVLGEAWPLPVIQTVEGPRSIEVLGALPVGFARQTPVIGVGAVDAAGEGGHIPLDAPELVADVRCQRARCAVDEGGIRLFAIDPSALSVGVRVDLVAGAWKVEGEARVQRESRTLDLVRCGLRAPEVSLLAGVREHRLPVAMARDCFKGKLSGLMVQSEPPTHVWIRGELPAAEEGWRVVELVFAEVPALATRMTLKVVRRDGQATALGAVEVPVAADYRPAQVRLRAPGLGPIDFVPDNRPVVVEVVPADARWADRLRLVPRSGFYTLPTAETVQAVEGARGQVPLRFAYRPPAVEEVTSDPAPLAVVETENAWRLRSMNVPLPLSEGERPVVRVECRRDGASFAVRAGQTAAVSFAERSGCRLLIDRDAIPVEAGVQLLRIEGPGIDEVVRVAPRGGVIEIALPTEGRKEFDTLKVSVSHEYGQAHYDFSPRQNLGAGARYRVVLGDSPLRISASTSLPTGLFRFGGAKEDKGAVALSAGAIGRMTLLYKEGRELPFGIEMGLFGTGLSSDPNLSIVAGVGFSVPVLNPDTALQTSFNLHAWFEYSPTRTAPGSSPWAFLFGPSFGVGKFSVNL